jgi:hypothetical protein
MCAEYGRHIHPLTHFPSIWLTPTATYLPDRTCFAFLFFVFVKKKKCHFCLFKIAIQGVSLWHFHGYKSIIIWIGSYAIFFSFLP